jgi:hypothetical protein
MRTLEQIEIDRIVGEVSTQADLIEQILIALQIRLPGGDDDTDTVVTVMDDGSGNVIIKGAGFTDDGSGNVTLKGVLLMDDGSGNVTIKGDTNG